MHAKQDMQTQGSAGTAYDPPISIKMKSASPIQRASNSAAHTAIQTPAGPGEFRMKKTFQRTVLTRPWLTFLFMGGSFGLFGAGTLNIFSMFSSNWDMLTQHGLMALASGSVWQLVELLGTLFLSMFFYTVFKTCEHALVEHLAHAADDAPPK